MEGTEKQEKEISQYIKRKKRSFRARDGFCNWYYCIS